MTNRDAFNLYMALEVAKALNCVENIDNEALVLHSCKRPDFGVHIKVYEKLRWLKYQDVGMPVGDKKEVIEWLDQEASEKVLAFLEESRQKFESEDYCHDCDWCSKELKGY